MNKIDFSFAGGFPLDQEVLGYMQQSYLQGFASLYGDAGSTPIILSGLLLSVSGGLTSITAGFFYYNGEVYACPALPPTAVGGGGTDVIVAVSDVGSSAIFEDASTHDVFRARTGAITVAVPVGGDVLFSSFKTFQQVFGEVGRRSTTPFNDLVVSGSNFGGTISYRKNLLTNSLHIKGAISFTSSAGFPAVSPPIYYAFGSVIPAEFRPTSTIPFKAFYRHHSSTLKDSSGIDFFRDINAELRNTGQFSFGFIRTDTPGTYNLEFNFNAPLD